MITNIVLAIHLILCVGLIGLVLVQQGKGADAGALLGGSADSVLGAGNAGNFITRLTTSMAISFFITSVILVKIYNSQSGIVGPGTGTVNPLQGSIMAPEVDKQKREAENLAPVGSDPVDSEPVGGEEATAEKVVEITSEEVEVQPAVEASAGTAAQEEKKSENSEAPAKAAEQ